MKLTSLALVVGCLQIGGTAVHAATTCSFNASPGFTVPNYVEGTAASQATSVTVDCNRASTADPSSVTYTVAFNSGLNTNRAAAVVGGTTYYVSYSRAATTACSPAINSVSGTMTWPTSGPAAARTGTKSVISSYAGCVASQTGMAAATYSDTIGLTLTHNAGAGTASGSAPVSIVVPAACRFSQTPGNISFAYQAFRGSALTASTTFGTTCTNQTPYTMAFDVATGTAAGLLYGLALSASSAIGSGLQQNYSITGTMAAGQSGDCTTSCSGSNAHSVIITY